MPCLDYLSQLRRARDEIEEIGASVIAVASGAPHQAQALMAEGIWFPCLVDPDKQVARTLGIRRIGLGWLDPLGIWAYARAAFRGARQGKITDPFQAPGVVLLDAESRARLVHRGTSLGDYPPLEAALAALRTL